MRLHTKRRAVMPKTMKEFSDDLATYWEKARQASGQNIFGSAAEQFARDRTRPNLGKGVASGIQEPGTAVGEAVSPSRLGAAEAPSGVAATAPGGLTGSRLARVLDGISSPGFGSKADELRSVVVKALGDNEDAKALVTKLLAPTPEDTAEMFELSAKLLEKDPEAARALFALKA